MPDVGAGLGRLRRTDNALKVLREIRGVEATLLREGVEAIELRQCRWRRRCSVRR